MSQSNWRTLPRTYLDFETGKPVEKKKACRKNILPFRKCEKVLARHKETNAVTCATIFSNGRVAVGDDVWRMSNRCDTCEYTYHMYKNRVIAEADYVFTTPAATKFYEETRGNAYAFS